ncbi:hypothetical protein V6N13_133440 [Hibiscus sabdariffa]
MLLCSAAKKVSVTDGSIDQLGWKLNTDRRFTVKSTYEMWSHGMATEGPILVHAAVIGFRRWEYGSARGRVVQGGMLEPTSSGMCRRIHRNGSKVTNALAKLADLSHLNCLCFSVPPSLVAGLLQADVDMLTVS